MSAPLDSNSNSDKNETKLHLTPTRRQDIPESVHSKSVVKFSSLPGISSNIPT